MRNTFPEASSIKVSVVIPTRMPDSRLDQVVRGLNDVLPEPSEIILVDDHNPLPAATRIRTISEQAPTSTPNSVCRVVRMEVRGGQQRATVAGIAAAAGRVIVTMDDDGAHPPALVPPLLSTLSELTGPGIVYGTPGPRAGSIRAAGTRINRGVFRLLLGVGPRVAVTSFRAFDAQLAQSFGTRDCRWVAPNTSAMLLAGSPRVACIPIPGKLAFRAERTPPASHSSRHSVTALIRSLLELALWWGPRGLAIRALGARQNG